MFTSISASGSVQGFKVQGMPSLKEVNVKRNEDDPEQVLEKALEDFSPTDSYTPNS